MFEKWNVCISQPMTSFWWMSSKCVWLGWVETNTLTQQQQQRKSHQIHRANRSLCLFLSLITRPFGHKHIVCVCVWTIISSDSIDCHWNRWQITIQILLPPIIHFASRHIDLVCRWHSFFLYFEWKWISIQNSNSNSIFQRNFFVVGIFHEFNKFMTRSDSRMKQMISKSNKERCQLFEN